MSTTISAVQMRPTRWVMGIDVSHHKGDIDFAALSTGWVQAQWMRLPVGFIIARATEGQDFVDEQWENNALGCTAYNIPYAAYHFATPDYNGAVITPDVEFEAHDHIAQLARMQAMGAPPTCRVPTWLDLEKNKANLTKEAYTAWVIRWMDIVNAWLNTAYALRIPGVPVTAGIYIGRSQAEEWLTTDHPLGKYPLWVPDWNNNPPRASMGWARPAIIQEAGSAWEQSVPGISSSAVDMNMGDADVILYDRIPLAA